MTGFAGAAPSPSASGSPPLEGPYKTLREAWIDHFEREYFRELLRRHDRNVAAASREAGVDRTYVYRMIRRHQL